MDEKKQLEECPSKEGSSDVKVTEGNICWVHGGRRRARTKNLRDVACTKLTRPFAAADNAKLKEEDVTEAYFFAKLNKVGALKGILDEGGLDDYQKEAIEEVMRQKKQVTDQIKKLIPVVPPVDTKTLERMLDVEAQLEEDLERIESLLLDATRRR